MRLYLPSEVDVPAELIYEILRNLNQRSLKRVRLVCTELAALARPLLFKSISLTLLTGHVARKLPYFSSICVGVALRRLEAGTETVDL